MTASKRVVVIGGGVLGVSTANQLRHGGADVELVTEGSLADGASGRSLSWLNSAGSRSPAYHALRMAGIDRYRTLFTRDPSRNWLRFDGAIYWASDDAQGTARERHAAELAHGYASRLLESEAPPVPGLDARSFPELAVHNPGEGWVSLPELINHLAKEFTGIGGKIHTETGRASVLTEHGRASGVRTETGQRFEADAVVLACGASTPSIAAELGIHIPDASPPAMLVHTEPLDSPMRAVLNTPRVSLRPNPDSGFALDHDWYTKRITRTAAGEYRIEESVVTELLAEASKLLSGDVRLRAADWRLGRKPVPGDGQPVLGQPHELPGCFLAFTHSGATLGLIVGELLAWEILNDARHPMLARFSPDRFIG